MIYLQVISISNRIIHKFNLVDKYNKNQENNHNQISSHCHHQINHQTITINHLHQTFLMYNKINIYNKIISNYKCKCNYIGLEQLIIIMMIIIIMINFITIIIIIIIIIMIDMRRILKDKKNTTIWL